MKGWAVVLVEEDPPEKEISAIYTDISQGNIVKSARTRKPPVGVSADTSVVQKSDPTSRRKKGANDHLDMPMTERVSDSERLEIPDEIERSIVVERIPKRTKTKRRFNQAGSPAKELIIQASKFDGLDGSKGLVLTTGDTPVGDFDFNETSFPNTQLQIENQIYPGGQSSGEDRPASTINVESPARVRRPELRPDFTQAKVRSTRSSTMRSNKASSNQSPRGSIAGDLRNDFDTLGARSQEGSMCVDVIKSAAGTSAADSGALTSLTTKPSNEELGQKNSASISQRSRRTSPSTGFHGQNSVRDSQCTSPLLNQTTPRQQLRSSFHQTSPQRQLRSSFHSSTNRLQDKSSILQVHESSTALPSTTAVSRILLDSLNSTPRSGPKSVATFQVNGSMNCQQDQRTQNPSTTNVEDMADESIRQRSTIELDGESSSGLSDLDSQEDFTEIAAAINLNSQQPELAAGQDPSTPCTKFRLARQKMPTLKALQEQQKKSRAQASKEKNLLHKAAANAKAVTKKAPAKPKLPKAATLASRRKKKVGEEDKKDDYQPENDLRFAISEPGMVSINSNIGTCRLWLTRNTGPSRQVKAQGAG